VNLIIMKIFLLFVLSLLFVNCSGEGNSKSRMDVDYAGDLMEYHRLDIYIPDGNKPKYPVVILIYGSAWLRNNQKRNDVSTSIGKALLDAGFAVVAPNHRSSSDAIFPAQINDIKAVIRFVRANAKEYQFNTSFIGITGWSSGGHLSALAGTTGFVTQYKINSASAQLEGNLGKYTNYSSSVDAVVDWFGPTDFLKMDSCGSHLVHNAPDSPESRLIGGPIQENKDKCALANPITYVNSNSPPFLIFHGAADPLVPYCESQMLFDALKRNGVACQFILVPDARHGPGLLEDKYFKIMTDFFTEELMKSNKTACRSN